MPAPDDLAFDVREPFGADELFLVETRLAPARTLVELAQRVMTIANCPPDWAQVAAAQLGAIALHIRRAWIGDRVVSEGRCAEPACAERIDISFSAETYLTHHRPRRPRNVTPDVDGWYRLTGTDVRFRIPDVTDLLAAGESDSPATELAARCMDPADVPRRVSRAVDRALAVLAPSLEDLVGGTCPECGSVVTLRFDPLTYTLAELRDTFAGIYRETHALASAYGWSEEAILNQPRSRRQRYAAMVFEERSRATRPGAA